MKKTMVQGYLYAVLSAVIFGCMPLMATGIYAQGMTPMALVCWRNLLALPAMALLAYRERVGAGALLGSVLVIAASVLIALSDLKRAKAAL